MGSQMELFAVDGQLLRLLPRAGASLRNPDVNLPVLRSAGDEYYLEMRVESNPDEPSEVGLTRRIPLVLRGRDQGLGIAQKVAARLQKKLGWSDALTAHELANYRSVVAASRKFREG